jgi:hypothetical protein
MAFYQCLKCKRRWEYPLAECPYCFVPLNKMESKTAHVSGVVKVAIPTLFHPNVPYFVLVLEDELGNAWGYKSEKEYKVGDEFRIEASNDPAAVAIWCVKYDVGEAVGKALELAGGANIGAGSKVVVLPTLAAPSHAYFRDNTSPEFLSAVLEMILARGVKAEDITVASQSFDDLPVGAVAQKSGLLAACQKFEIMPLDLAEVEFTKSGQLEIANPVLAADLAINLAMEKIGQASATTNFFKVLKKENYLGQKYLSSDAEIAAALEPLLSKTITIGEAENVQRSNKLTTFMGLVLAGRSARNVDRIFNEAAKSFRMPEIIKEIDIASIPVAGRTIKEVQYQAEIF